MKLVFPINVCVLVCFAALTAAQDSTTPREADCQKYMNNVCTREYIPLCGDDGVTHSNECVLCMKSRNENKNIMVVKRGECNEVTTAAAFTSEAPPPNPNSI